MAARIEVEVIGEIGSLERKLAKAQADLTRFKAQAESNAAGIAAANTRAGSSFAVLGSKSDSLLKTLKSPTGAFAGGLVASAALSQLKSAIDAGSALNEQISKSNIVFADSADEIQAWSKTTAAAFGISRSAALEAAGTFGTITRSMGLPAAAAADLSKNLVNLAGDLASFNDVGTEDALLALRSAIVGEYEPLRRLGSALSETRVQTQALAETGKRSAKELTNQEKVTARYNLILKDTSLAQGDAARTAESFANQQRQLAAKAADLQANLGTLLLPAMTEIVSVMNDGITAASALAEAIRAIGNIDVGPLGDVADIFGRIADTATRIGPIGFVRNTADLVKLATGGDSKDARDPTTGIFSSFSNKTIAGLPGGPGAGGPSDARRVPPSLSGLIGGPGSSGADVVQTSVPLQVRNDILKSVLGGDRGGALRSLLAARDALKATLTRDDLTSEQTSELLGALQGVMGEVQGIYAEMAADSAKTKAAIQDARDKAKNKAIREAEKLASTLETLGDGIASAVSAASEAIKRMQAGLKKQADDFKAAVLDRLDRTQSDRDTKRALTDAQKAYRESLAINGKQFSVTALRNLQDAQLDRQRFLVESSTVTPAAGGGFNINGPITINGVQNVDQMIAELQKRAKKTTPQTRGRAPANIYGFGS